MKEEKILKHDPLTETEKILREDFYGRRSTENESDTDDRPVRQQTRRRRRKSNKPKPTHYKVICISMYTKDIKALEEKVAELKRRGYTRANKSQLIRFALSQVDIDKMPPPNP